MGQCDILEQVHGTVGPVVVHSTYLSFSRILLGSTHRASFDVFLTSKGPTDSDSYPNGCVCVCLFVFGGCPLGVC